MRVSGETITALLPIRFACTAAAIAAGLLPYMTMSHIVSVCVPKLRHPARTPAAAQAAIPKFPFIVFLLS